MLKSHLSLAFELLLPIAGFTVQDSPDCRVSHSLSLPLPLSCIVIHIIHMINRVPENKVLAFVKYLKIRYLDSGCDVFSKIKNFKNTKHLLTLLLLLPKMTSKITFLDFQQ